MAAQINGIFDKNTAEAINKCKLLVVGAGGVGCELLKTLVLTGFEDIHVIDLDTIDLSNLNRQFLFHKQHIGKPKAVVAKESVLNFNPKAKITSYHDSITNTEYNVEFYRQFSAVANALDNVAARSHVNRMCMAADVPLIESGSAGFLGQTTVHKKKVTECFECLPRKPQKTYPGCTIRNTPSEPVHCIVWSKHLFNQLFGESDADDEVSPDVTDEEITNKEANGSALAPKVSTREWAKSTNYDPLKLFNKLFNEDILYLKSMTDLWKKRKCPVPLKWDELPDAVPGCSSRTEADIEDFRRWSMKECGEVFKRSMIALHKRIEEGGSDTVLIWDKDDDVCLDFVAACSNIRSHIFHIPQKNRFDIKAIAGNIIPAVATTNAVVGGLVVLQLLKIVKGEISKCKTSWINETYNAASKLISCGQLEKPNSACFVCSTTEPEISVKLNIKSLTLRTLDEKILKEKLLMVQPDVVINDGSGSILISSDPEEMSEEMFERPLSSFNLGSDSRLSCEDFFQNFKIRLVIIHDKDLNGQDFLFESDLSNVKPSEEKESSSKEGASKSVENVESELMDVEPEIDIIPMSPETTTIADDENGMEPPTKKVKTGH